MSSPRTEGREDLLKLQAEVNQPLLCPVNFPQVEVGSNQADLIANPVRHHRRFGIIQHDTLLLVQPTRALVDLGDNGIETKYRDFVGEHASLGIERLSLPREEIDCFRDFFAKHSAGRDDRRAISWTVRNRTSRALRE